MTPATTALRQMPGPREPRVVQGFRWLRQPDYYSRMAERYGPVYRLRFPFYGDVVMFTTSGAARQIVKLSPAVAHSGMEVMREGMGPRAVVVLNEDEHLRMRKLLMPPMLGTRLKRWESFIQRRTLEDITRWPVGEPFAIRPIAEAITMDVITKIVFGMRDTARGRELRRALPGLYAFDGISGLGAALGFAYRWARLDVGRWSPWGRYRRNRDRVDELIYSEIALRRGEFAAAGPDASGIGDEGAGSEDRGDLLSVLLAARDEDGNGLTDAELRDQLVAMLLAGHETSATAIAWAIERLMHNPAVLRRLLAALGTGDTGYLDAVIKETLRSRPVAHEVPRLLAGDAVIDGWALPAGTSVGIAIPVLHHDPVHYPDPEAFRPERFLDGNEPTGSAWLPFGGGVRRCPGANLALLETRVVLATILRNVRLVADRPAPERPTALHVTTVPDRGGRVIVTERLRPGPAVVL